MLRIMADEMKDKPEDYWKQKLTPEQYRVLRQKGTEMPGSGQYINNEADGMYHCAACEQALFLSDSKYHSDSIPGWPSFANPVDREHVEFHEDTSHGLRRTEVTCKNCGSHLGHVFDDGPADEGGQHYCINSISLNFEPKQEKD